MEIIKSELNKIKNNFKKSNKLISDEQAFEYLSLYLFYYNDGSNMFEKYQFDIEYSITNGPNDGGIDFVHYDDDNSKVIIGQCKYSQKLDMNEIISELNKMSSTVENFRKNNTGQYNKKVRQCLQEALDSLPEGNEGNVEYVIFTASSFDQNKLHNKINNENNIYSSEMVSIKTKDDFNSKIRELIEKTKTVESFKIKIDKAKNWLQYDTNNASGVVVNISSDSIRAMYNMYIDNGLLDMNIRKYVPNKGVDSGIEETLNNERQNFWFYNNGIIIACEDFELDGDRIQLEEFSIVNGGQTTHKIGEYKGSNNQEFYVPCKIIKVDKNKTKMFEKIAEASNSQKPIYPRDLKANAPEMKMLKKWLEDSGVYLEIKRGEKKKAKNFNYSIKNDELGQILYSFIYQSPGTARSGKKSIFDNQATYNKLYKKNYEKDPNKKEFILDLIKLLSDYSIIETELKNGNEITPDEKNILKNGKYVIFATFGALYALANDDVKKEDIIGNASIFDSYEFEYGSFISNYKEDDYERILKEIITFVIQTFNSEYQQLANKGEVTSVSNLFKSDKKYRESLIKALLNTTNYFPYNKSFPQWINIFKR